ncbi:hydroxylamine oxidase [bacterium]|nr:hydroxylamine oxidase [bacterium]
MRRVFCFLCCALFFCFLMTSQADSEETNTLNMSRQTKRCLDCHENASPGIVEDWRASLHSATTPKMALAKERLTRRMSADSVKENLGDVIVGCYECHSLNTDKHQDSFNHFGLKINVVVSPQDCSICHPSEVKEYVPSKKGYAFSNLEKNPVYKTLVKTVISQKAIKDEKVEMLEESDHTKMDTCYGCHGTEVKVDGLKKVFSGPLILNVPNLINWPNQGVGRINPDGSQGSCAACHPRHSFSIDIARKPYTCAQCHLEPDVPAWNVYKESKHANIYSSKFIYWNFKEVPWVLGKDFMTPTCAACHNSLIVTPKNKVIAERTHDFGARLWVRIFGLIYSHAQPAKGETYIIKNKDGLPMPTDFITNPASEYLINRDEQSARKKGMMNLCIACHSTGWVENHFVKLDSTIAETDKMVLNATLLLTDAWGKNLADKTNPFDEVIEHKWITQWLFYANSIRYASAMTGAPDYAAFKNGWWEMTKNLTAMEDWIKVHKNK